MIEPVYIPADIVDSVLLDLEERVIDNPFAVTTVAMAIDLIQKVAESDGVQFTHCAECEYFDDTEYGGGWGECRLSDEKDEIEGYEFVKRDDYCSRAIKRDESEETK